MSYQVSCCHLHTPLYFFSCHPTALLQRDNNHATVLWLQSQMNEKTCAAWSATVVTTRRRLVCLIFHFKVWGRIHSVWRAPLNSYIFVWGLVRLEGQNHVKKKKRRCAFRFSRLSWDAFECQVWTAICGESWSNLVLFAVKLRGLNKPTETAGRGKVVHWRTAWWGGGEKESWVAGDQSIIVPVGLYWLCSLTGLPRSMCSQPFCMGRWRSVPGLTLTFYSDTCVCVCVVY